MLIASSITLKEFRLIPFLDSLSKEEIIEFHQRHRLFSNDLIQDRPFIIKSSEWNNLLKDQVSHSLYLTSVFLNLMAKLKEEQIELIPLKGPLLAVSLYGDVGKRYFGDLDFLVKGNDVGAVIKLMNQWRFVKYHPRKDLSSEQWDYYFKWKKDIGLVNRDQRVTVELHAGVYYHKLLKRENEKLFYHDLEELQFAGVKVQCMNRENTFLYLIYHGAQHQYFRLFWLKDIAEILKRWDLDHQNILRSSYSLGFERLLGLGLELTRNIFNSEIPADYNELLKNNQRIIDRLKRLCMKRILGPEFPGFIGKVQHHYFLFLLKPGLKYKWYVFISIFHRWYIRKFLGGN